MVMKKSILSIKRKPVSKKPDSGSGSTSQTRFHPVPPTPISDDWVGDLRRRQTIRKTRSQTKVVTNYSVHDEKTTNRSTEDVSMTVSVSDEGKSIVLFGMKFEDNRKAVVEVATPINNSAPLLRTRNDVDGAKYTLQSKPLTDPLPNNKKKKLLSKGNCRKFVMPYDFIDQQRAYFKEIDAFKLEVEEVEQVSVDED